jgi:N-acetyl sugar amidotransferase
MPDTKPGVFLDQDGVCSACRSVERKKDIDWDARARELAELCDSIRGTNGNGYDCLVPVSGGKDSHYQVWVMKVLHNMNVLGVCVVPHLQTSEGIANLNNIVEAYGIDLIKIALKPSVFKRIRQTAFLDLGEPNWADHCSVFAGAARAAYMYQVPLVVWGEDISVEFGGSGSGERVASAENLIKNDLIKKRTLEDFYDDTVDSSTTYFYRHPSIEELKSRKLKSIYLGYYHNWDGKKHYEIAKEQGFQGRKLGPLSGNILDYDNMDEKLCEINIWFKFLKFGFWRPTDQCCYQIWNGRMTREEAVKIVNAKQYEFPKEYFRDFLEFQEITETQFWETVEKFRNKDIWHKVGGEWKLKTPLI